MEIILGQQRDLVEDSVMNSTFILLLCNPFKCKKTVMREKGSWLFKITLVFLTFFEMSFIFILSYDFARMYVAYVCDD